MMKKLFMISSLMVLLICGCSNEITKVGNPPEPLPQETKEVARQVIEICPTWVSGTEDETVLVTLTENSVEITTEDFSNTLTIEIAADGTISGSDGITTFTAYLIDKPVEECPLDMEVIDRGGNSIIDFYFTNNTDLFTLGGASEEITIPNILPYIPNIPPYGITNKDNKSACDLLEEGGASHQTCIIEEKREQEDGETNFFIMSGDSTGGDSTIDSIFQSEIYLSKVSVNEGNVSMKKTREINITDIIRSNIDLEETTLNIFLKTVKVNFLDDREGSGGYLVEIIIPLKSISRQTRDRTEILLDQDLNLRE